MKLESRPATIIAAEYKKLPFPILDPVQEVAFDLGITATDAPLEVAGVVFQGYHEHQLLFEQRWPARVLRSRLGEQNLRIEPGTGLALRSVHFQMHAYELLTQIEVVVLAQLDDKEELEHATLEIPVRFHSNKTNLHLPLHDAWWVIQGADWSDRHKQEVFSQAYALDFARLGADSRTFEGRGIALEDHYSWQQPVYAAAGGKVAAVIFDLPDVPPGVLADARMFRSDPRRTLGNAVAVSHGNGEFSYYACLQQASLTVNEGQVIKRGALLGHVGNSGLSPGPHLHFHLAEGPNPFIDQGLPAQFSHFWAGGQYFEQPVTIPTRMIVTGENQMPDQDEIPLYTTVDDELYDELSQLAGQKIVFAAVWEDSLGTALEGEEVTAQEQMSFDIDLYLADGAYFELYSATCFDSLDSDPWQGLALVSERLAAVARQGAVLHEVAVGEDDQLVLVLHYGQGKQLYLPVAAWLLEEWDELPGA